MVSACSLNCASRCRRVALSSSASLSCPSNRSLRDATSPAAAWRKLWTKHPRRRQLQQPDCMNMVVVKLLIVFRDEIKT